MIGMCLELVVFGWYEDEGEGIEDFVCVQLDEMVIVLVDVGLEGVGIVGVYGVVDVVVGDEQVGLVLVCDFLVILYLGFKDQFYIEFFVVCLQDVEQVFVVDVDEIVVVVVDDVVFEMYVDVILVVEFVGDGGG